MQNLMNDPHTYLRAAIMMIITAYYFPAVSGLFMTLAMVLVFIDLFLAAFGPEKP